MCVTRGRDGGGGQGLAPVFGELRAWKGAGEGPGAADAEGADAPGAA